MKTSKAILSFVFVLGIFINSTSCYAQNWNWAKSMGGTSYEYNRVTCTDASGNVFVAGGFNSSNITIGGAAMSNAGASGYDAYIAKYNSAGTYLWSQRIGGSSGSESITGLCTDATGNVYATGYFNSTLVSVPPLSMGNPSTPTNNIFVACFNSAGTPQWLQPYGNAGEERASSCAYSNSLSCLYVTGYYYGNTFPIGSTTLNNTSSAGKSDIFIAKFTPLGAVTWAKTTGASTSDDVSSDIVTDAAGDINILGYFSPALVTGNTTIGLTSLTSYGNQDIFIAKYTSLGNPQWARRMGSTQGGDYPGGIAVDASNNIYLNGDFNAAPITIGTSTLTNSGGYDAFIAKYSATGLFLWSNKLSGAVDEYGNDLTVDVNSNAYMTGSFSGTTIATGTISITNTNPGTTEDIFVAKYNSAGLPIWLAKATGTGTERSASISSDAVGNIYIAGDFDIAGTAAYGSTTLTSVGSADGYIAKIGCLTTSISGISAVCAGTSVTLTANGATSYTWNTGATTSSIIVSPTTSVTYSLVGSIGACQNTSPTFSLTYLPASINAGVDLSLFCGQSQVISTTANPTNPVSVIWTPTLNLSSASAISPTATAGSSPISYTVTATLTNGCVANDIVNVSAYAQTPSICMVTVDSLSINNEIYWEKGSYTNVDSFIVYREVSTALYHRIGATKKTALCMYVDTNRSVGPANGNPNISSYKYKLQLRDTCGNYSVLSPYHSTIFIQDQLNGNFNWNAYAVEGTTLSPVSVYNLVRRTTATGALTIVGSTTSNLATDPNYNTLWTTGVKWMVDAIGFNCDPALKLAGPSNPSTQAQKVKTKSNQANDKTILTEVNTITKNLSSILIYPNPANDFIMIDLGVMKDNVSIEITNVLGETVLVKTTNESTNTIHINDFAKGMYVINIKSNNQIIVAKKLVVQ